MNAASIYLLSFFVVFAVAAASPLVWVPRLRKWGVIDVPNARSSHNLPAIRGAGAAVVTAVAAGLLVGLPLLTPADRLPLAAILGMGLVAAAVGFIEDVRGISIGHRLAAQVLVGLVLALWLCLITEQPPWLVVVVGLAIAYYINVANFMDGVDGMSALHGVVAGAYFMVVGRSLDEQSLVMAGVVTAAAFLGFMPWNVVRGRVFLGDSGSYLLGVLVAACAAAVFLSGGTVLQATAPMLPYLADTGYAIVRRAWRRERLSEPHRCHVYQRLTDLGWSHLASSCAVALASATCCGMALTLGSNNSSPLITLGVIGIVIGCYLSAPRWAVVLRVRASA